MTTTEALLKIRSLFFAHRITIILSKLLNFTPQYSETLPQVITLPVCGRSGAQRGACGARRGALIRPVRGTDWGPTVISHHNWPLYVPALKSTQFLLNYLERDFGNLILRKQS